MPVIQKYIWLIGSPSGVVTRLTTPDSAPSRPAFKIAMAGTMVRKMPANNLPTSMMGNHVNPFAVRLIIGVIFQEMKARASRDTSRAIFCSSQCTW